MYANTWDVLQISVFHLFHFLSFSLRTVSFVLALMICLMFHSLFLCVWTRTRESLSLRFLISRPSPYIGVRADAWLNTMFFFLIFYLLAFIPCACVFYWLIRRGVFFYFFVDDTKRKWRSHLRIFGILNRPNRKRYMLPYSEPRSIENARTHIRRPECFIGSGMFRGLSRSILRSLSPQQP